MTPRVSVLMPVRNGLPWLREALDGLARQTLADLEIVALEDGSTDGTAECLRAWPDERLRVIATGGVGMARALNIGLAAARAPFVARHDADDVSAPIRMEAQLHYLLSHPAVDVVASTADYIDERGRPVATDWVKTVRRQQDVALTPREIADLMPLTCCLTHGSVMARVEVLRAAGGYLPDIWPVEDYDLWLRLLPVAAIAKLPLRLYRYRVHDAQLSAQVRDDQLRQALAAKFRHLRRVVPDLPFPARLRIAGEGRGADVYRALGPEHGFEVTAAAPVPAGGAALDVAAVREASHEVCDLLVVANFADVERHGRAFAAGPSRVRRIGNFFVPARDARQEAA